ncbi:hypothetical protein CA223_05530 [Sphingomonas koreensis]|uniref:Uncharacterized protein n=1 Tax=Sphingomonas koreensis TaxID=93064 RepID=A0A1L6JBS2_9SPHN|nr:hypothetical protein [Sphingomonas koreensis]APR53372.1 hypothetical protein BRX40_13885 [Sphingomonas koreensis]MDC7809942.1 hypothetical protein [Sphingomonas koreensis]RSU24505.1 hypothetical protein CA224_01955 [Sphingomonas koreensis]RSU25150.1 hypothetical protein CA222_13545 [Sphingomonas koreensis]RSU30175.1 hypothetical protein CA225_05805 [Sphingomonas koreensis]
MTLDPETSAQAGLSVPPVGVAAVTLAGIELQQWILILTAIWLLMQMGWFIFEKVSRLLRDRAEREDAA